MSCNPCCVTCIKVTSVTTSATAITLDETAVVLADLTAGQRIELIIDPTLLPQSTLPVVLSDDTTTVPLWMENGNVMRENIFLPFCRRLARCKDNAHVRSFYFGDPAHLLIFRSKRY